MPWLGTHRAILAVLKVLKDAMDTHINAIETELNVTVPAVNKWFSSRRGAPSGDEVQVEVYENGTAEVVNRDTTKVDWIAENSATLELLVPWEVAIRSRNSTASTVSEVVRRSRVYAAAALRSLRSKVAFAGADSAVQWIVPAEVEVLALDEFTDDQARLQTDLVKIRGTCLLCEINDVEGTALTGDDAWILTATLEA